MLRLRRMGIFYIKSISILSNCLYRYLPGQLALFPLLPPLFQVLKLAFLYRLRLGICLNSFGKFVLPVPDLFSRLALDEEKQIRRHARVGLEHRIGQTHDRMEVTALQEMLAYALLHPVAGERPVGQHDRRAATLFQVADHEHQEQVRTFRGAVVLGKVGLSAVGYGRAEGRVGQDHVHPVLLADAGVFPVQAVGIIDVGHFDVVEDEVGHRQHERQGLEFHAVDGGFQRFQVVDALHVLPSDVLDGAGEEAPGAAGGVQHLLAQPGIDELGHDVGDRPGGVEFTVISGALQVPEDGFIHVAEHVPVFGDIEVDLVELVQHLADDGAVFHVVVGPLEDLPDDEGPLVAGAHVEVLELRE